VINSEATTGLDPPFTPAPTPSAVGPPTVEHAWFTVGGWSAPPYERPGRQRSRPPGSTRFCLAPPGVTMEGDGSARSSPSARSLVDLVLANLQEITQRFRGVAAKGSTGRCTQGVADVGVGEEP